MSDESISTDATVSESAPPPSTQPTATVPLALNEKARVAAIVDNLPEDTVLAAVVSVGPNGSVQVGGAAMGVHALAGLMIAGTRATGEALQREGAAIVAAMTTLASAGTSAQATTAAISAGVGSAPVGNAPVGGTPSA